MHAVLTMSMDNTTMKMDMDLESKEPGDQRMSEVVVDIEVSASPWKTSDAKLYTLFQQNGENYHTYARLRQGGCVDKKGQEVLFEEGIQNLLGQMQQSSMASVEMCAENPEKVGVKEEGRNYVFQLIPSHGALINIINKTGSSSRIKNLSNSHFLLTLVVEKNTYQVKNLTLDFDSDVTVQGKKVKIDMKVDMASDENPQRFL